MQALIPSLIRQHMYFRVIKAIHSLELICIKKVSLLWNPQSEMRSG